MRIKKASIEELDTITEIVQSSIRVIYPKYYPKEVVDFFLEHHAREKIEQDILAGNALSLYEDEMMVGTGSHEGEHVTRVYVAPQFQGKGYGSYIMDCLEAEISMNYGKALLDASLPAVALYAKRGYRVIEYHKHLVENDVVLVYEVMEKELSRNEPVITYNGRVFGAKSNSENGEVSEETIFRYHQDGDMLWAEYSGGEVVRGSIIGTVNADASLDFYYQHFNRDGVVRIGKCHSVPRFREDGKLEMYEEWEWLNGDRSRGDSVVSEV